MKKLIFVTMVMLFVLCGATSSFAGDKLYADKENSLYKEEPHEYTEILKNATEKDIEALEQVVYCESVGAFADERDYNPEDLYSAGCFECSVCVIETVLNRVLDGRWGNSIYKVCHAPGQFVCKKYKTKFEYAEEAISDSIEHVWHEGRTILPSTSYTCFATKKQTIGKNHIWHGCTNSDGTPKKTKGMYFCELK